jgi:hypothetical protein
MRNFVHYLPILTTIIAAAFAIALWYRWREKRAATYLAWWTFGVFMYGLGTLAESMTTIFGWNEGIFRLWYISGALLGGFPLAQGVAYLLLPQKWARRTAIIFMSFIAVAAVFVLIVPMNYEAVETYRLTGGVMAWSRVRLFSPFINLYSFILLVGGAFWSAWLYWKRTHDLGSRVIGNVAIAIGGLLPGIGGSFARAGQVEVLYVTELIGLILIWIGYQVMVADSVISIHVIQRINQRQST